MLEFEGRCEKGVVVRVVMADNEWVCVVVMGGDEWVCVWWW